MGTTEQVGFQIRTGVRRHSLGPDRSSSWRWPLWIKQPGTRQHWCLGMLHGCEDRTWAGARAQGRRFCSLRRPREHLLLPPRLVGAQEGTRPSQSVSFEYMKMQVDFGKATLFRSQRDRFVARG